MSLLPPKPQRRKPDFTLTMVNIVFLLLLFFITTGSLTNREEAQAPAPETSRLPLEKLPRPLLLIEEGGRLLLDGKPVASGDLVEAVEAARAVAGADKPINLLAARQMPAADLLAVAGRLRSEGLPVNIVTLRQPGEGAAR